MSEQELKPNGQAWWQQLLFLRLFQGFRIAVQPGKLAVALLGVILLFLGGWAIDFLTPQSAMVLSDVEATLTKADKTGLNPGTYSELEAYVQEAPVWLDKGAPLPRKDPQAYHKFIRDKNESELSGFLKSDEALKEVAGIKQIRKGKALAEIKERYKDKIEVALEAVQERYEKSLKSLEKEEDEAEREEAEARLKQTRTDLTKALLGEFSGSPVLNDWPDTLCDLRNLQGKELESAQKDVEKISKTLRLAGGYRTAELERGQGVFQAIVEFKFTRMKRALSALILDHDFGGVKSQIYEMVMAICWLCRMHWFIGGILMLYCLAIYAVIGGALCRMAAVQFSRDERIGPWRALQFSLGKFGSYFTAPLIPVGIMVFVGIFIALGGLLGAIPRIGEILAPIFMGLALFGGFVIALVAVGLMAGYNLMYPTIAVEGSDSFDAISRAFSYVFARPWRMGFYSLVAAVYGGICYAFVRVFAWLLLISVHIAAGMGMNIDDSSVTGSMDIRGKLEAIWPAPTLADLQPSINWVTLNWSECFGAAVIWVWAALVTGLVLAFVLSFFYSMNTVIYCLLRKHVDDTDLEDIYVEQDVDELVGDESPVEEGAPSEGGEEAPADSEDEASTKGEASEDKDDSAGENNGLEKTE